ncbi:MAG: hypothetical protein P8Q14_05890 [Vicingaceae bacterium]|nr:hypothetical protein [Vicingaceae bacterium]
MTEPKEFEQLFSYVVNLTAFDGNRWHNENYNDTVESFQGSTFDEIDLCRSQALDFIIELDNIIQSEKYVELKNYGLSQEIIGRIEKSEDKAVEILFITDEVFDEKIYTTSLIEMLEGLNNESQQFERLGKNGLNKQRVSLVHEGEKYNVLFSDFLQIEKKLISNGYKK